MLLIRQILRAIIHSLNIPYYLSQSNFCIQNASTSEVTPQQPVQISNRKLQSKSKRSTQCRYTTLVATQSGTLKCPSQWSSRVRVMPASCCYLGRPIQTQPRHHNNNLDQVTPQVQATAANNSVQISEPRDYLQSFKQSDRHRSSLADSYVVPVAEAVF